MTIDIADRLAGAVWGHLVGDACGVPYEFQPAGTITDVHFGVTGTHRQPPGTWSDDGALMLALLDSLLRDRTSEEPLFDTQDQGTRALAWADHGAYTPDHDGRFDIGGATSTALARIRTGTSAEEAGGIGDRDQGNGSLMRILPLALVGREIGDVELIDRAHRASSVTHRHPVAQVTCALYVLVARSLLDGSSRAQALADARSTLRSNYTSHDAGRLPVLDTVEAWTGRSGSGWVVDAFWSAWDAFAGAQDYRDAIERAIRYGNDTDTTAAIAGGLAGLRFGRSGITAQWLATMRGSDIVEPLLARLTAQPRGEPVTAGKPVPQGARTSESHPLRVDWVDLRTVPRLQHAPGRLGMTFAPGKHDLHGHAGAHWRDLTTDIVRLREHFGVARFVLLLEDHELDALGIADIRNVVPAHGIELLRYPIPDGGVPTDQASTMSLIKLIVAWVSEGERVVVACRGGLGRTGTIVGCVLREAGLDGPAAIELTRGSRSNTIENRGQEAYVSGWTDRRRTAMTRVRCVR